MGRGANSGILMQPLGRDWGKRCPACGRRWALKLLRRERNEFVGWVEYYRCKYCQKQCEFAERIPPKAV